ncbi:MAG: sugar transferase [Ruminococcaceae bacterium]|nr:sugar transferase [Oscillospiraceae bacterium]
MYKHFFKRFFDILCGLAGCLVFAVSFIFVAPLIYFTDKGPVFYNATRRGKNGKEFTMYKYRSMAVNAPQLKNADGSTYSGDDDPRVTKLGRILRKTSVDELPQFINVLKGDMSVIGPRPTVKKGEIILSELDENRRKHYMVRPGVTGYSQAYFRNSITQEEKFANDAYYADHISFALDVKIFFKTIMSVLGTKNINTSPEQNQPVSAE